MQGQGGGAGSPSRLPPTKGMSGGGGVKQVEEVICLETGDTQNDSLPGICGDWRGVSLEGGLTWI